MGVVRLTVPGPIRGKGRPRFNAKTGQTYTPAATVSAEQRIQMEWIAAGRPRLGSPLHMSLRIVMPRPKAHFKTDGTLSKRGRECNWPAKRPDIDNVVKLVCDALNGLAYADDAHIVDIHAQRCWADDGEPEGLLIGIAEIAQGMWTLSL